MGGDKEPMSGFTAVGIVDFFLLQKRPCLQMSKSLQLERYQQLPDLLRERLFLWLMLGGMLDGMEASL